LIEKGGYFMSEVKRMFDYIRIMLFSLAGVLAISFFDPAAAAIITVTNSNDNGPGSLRQAIIDAAPGDTINFGITGTITLTTGELLIYKNLTINGTDASDLAISGNNSSRIVRITADSVNISNVTITNGNSYGSPGGGIWIEEMSSLTLADSIISNNSGEIGGGIYNKGVLTVLNVTISGNTASLWGGGISNTGDITIVNSTVSYNTAESGGGILNAVYLSGSGIITSGNATVSNVTISGNIASAHGGGITSSGTNVGGRLTLTSLALNNCTLNNNSAATGGGLFNQFGTATLENTVIAHSSSGGNCNGTIISMGHNLDSGNACGFASGGDLINTDPLLGPLQNNGGPTFTHALFEGSPAIDAGDNGGIPATDQRGYPRIWNGTVDIGAYEYGQSLVSVPSLNMWGVIILALLAGIGAVCYLRVQRNPVI
jgi:hypothetical protein